MIPAISERGGGFVSVIDVQEAFRRGIRGADFVPDAAPSAPGRGGGPVRRGRERGRPARAEPACGAARPARRLRDRPRAAHDRAAVRPRRRARAGRPAVHRQSRRRGRGRAHAPAVAAMGCGRHRRHVRRAVCADPGRPARTSSTGCVERSWTMPWPTLDAHRRTTRAARRAVPASAGAQRRRLRPGSETGQRGAQILGARHRGCQRARARSATR